MIGPLQVPPVAAITDALTLLRVIIDPKQAEVLLSNLKEATDKYNKLVADLPGREQNVINQEKLAYEKAQAQEMAWKEIVAAQSANKFDRQDFLDYKEKYAKELAMADSTLAKRQAEAQAYQKQQNEREIKLNLQELDLRKKVQELDKRQKELEDKATHIKGLFN